ncbi:MAG: DUF6456 domain-containing protein [Pseudolabrys sp.]
MPISGPRKARQPEAAQPQVDAFRGRHLALAQAEIETELGRTRVLVDEAESPLVWLARRRGRDGQALIEPHQLLAGERLRADFTLANLMPRTTSSWDNPIQGARRGLAHSGAMGASDAAIAARQRVHRALDVVGPEFSGLLLDVCCFLKRLEDIERERVWPARSAKVVLLLGLDRLARHYGFGAKAEGRARAAIRTWLADEAGA